MNKLQRLHCDYLEASWHCWICFQFYLLAEIWQVTNYHQQDLRGCPVDHQGSYQIGCRVIPLGLFLGAQLCLESRKRLFFLAGQKIRQLILILKE